MSEKEQWYSNQQLYEMFMGKLEEINNKLIKLDTKLMNYNNLHSKVDDHDRRITTLESGKKEKAETNKAWRDNIGWVIAIIMSIIAGASVSVQILQYISSRSG